MRQKLPDSLVLQLLVVDRQLDKWLADNPTQDDDDIGEYVRSCQNAICDIVLDKEHGNPALVKALVDWPCLKGEEECRES